MNLLFTHAWIYTAESDELIKNGILATEGDRIAYVGPADEAWTAKKYDRVIDASGKLLMPGLVNTHAHSAMTLLRGRGTGLPLKRWLEEAIWPVEDLYTDEDYYVGSQMAVAEMLLSGTTCFSDMYMGMPELARVLKETGMRGVLSRGIVAFTEDMLGPKLQENVDLFERFHGTENGRITVMFGPHAEYTNTLNTLKTMADTARSFGAGLHIHVSETKSEHEECIGRHGMTPVRVLEKAGFFDSPVLCAHCVYVTDDDMKVLAEAGAGVSHNPSSNMKLGSGLAPVRRMRQAGIRVGIGTDGVASNDRLDMLREMDLTALMMAVQDHDPAAVTAPDVLRMATLGGAEALGMADTVGSLKAGKHADLILLDVTGPAYRPEKEMLNHLVYSASASDVVMTVIDGQILMEDRRLLTLDLADVTRNFTRCADRLLSGR